MNINNLIQSARQHYLAGNLLEAERIYRKILKLQPNNASAYYELGIVFEAKGLPNEAIVTYKKAITIDPEFPGSYNNLGNVLKKSGQLDEAISYYRKAVELAPGFAGSHYNLAQAVHESGRLDEAATYYRKALEIDPTLGNAYYNLGNTLRDMGQFEEAADSYHKALQINPENVHACNNLGNVLRDMGQVEEAVICYRKALQIDPASADAYDNLGNVSIDQGNLSEALWCYQKALEIDQRDLYAYNNLAMTLQRKGQLDEAEKYYRQALEIGQDSPFCYSNLLLIMNYSSRHYPAAIFSEHLRFAEQFAEPFSSSIPHHTNKCIPNRRLKIGYVSPDFRRHAVAYFIEPVIIAHNRKHFEIFCYSNSLKHDEVRNRFQDYADQWSNIAGMSDDNVTELIRKDQIDILVDLAGHTANNRILVFARKAAPIQISWIGYLSTTGLSTMDYKITDTYTDPPGETEQFYTEKLMRLPESFLCYLPDRDSPEVGFLPALSEGHITFGSFNNFAKVTSEVFTLWAKILSKLPDSRLILKAKSFHDKTTSQYALNMFTQRGVAVERITLQSWDPSPKHLESYNLVDIGLDTFPFNGAATTCEALWMGVPVITLSGIAYHSRVGTSLLSNIGLKEFIAYTPEEYINIAINLAKDTQRLKYFRENLRDMMSQSPLMNADQFIHNLENCYRTMWEAWCESA